MLQTEFTPYYAVIFTSALQEDIIGYAEMAEEMEKLARQQKGYLGFESARSDIGISISYWKTKEDIAQWKKQNDHLMAQKLGREQWYKSYTVRVCTVDCEYGFEN